VEVEEQSRKEHASAFFFLICMFSFLGREVETGKVKEHHFQQHGAMGHTLEELNTQKTERSILKLNTFCGFISQF